MKIFVINLDSRPDRLEYMKKQLEGFDWERFPAVDGYKLTLGEAASQGFSPLYEWVDPLLGRRHTITDIAAVMSHYKIWEKCAELNQNVIIFEDDSELIGVLDTAELDSLLEQHDIIYLDHREMFEEKSIVVDDKFVIPYYPYWNNAYALSPRLAKKIVESSFKKNIIPVDEFYPLLNNVDYNSHCLSDNSSIKLIFNKLKTEFADLIPIKSLAYRNKVFRQVPRKVLGSDIENGKQIMSHNVHVITVATDESKLSYLQTSASKFNINFINLGKGVEWHGGDMIGPGGAQKLHLVKTYVNQVPGEDIVLFVDGYDVFFNDELETIVDRFKGFNCRILFAAEKSCWPDKSLAPLFEADTDYKYLNSGVYIGYASDICSLIENCPPNSEDDQLFLQKKFIVDKFDANNNYKLDTENYIFQCLANAHEDVYVKANKQIANRSTNCCTCIVHGNGGASVKEHFDNLYNTIFQPEKIEQLSGISFLKPAGYDIVAPDILEMDFMTPEMCAKLIEKAENVGKWESMYGDKFPAQEMRIRELDINLFEQLELYLKEHVYPLVEQYWYPLSMYGLRDAFIIKYSPETQASLKCHHDASLVSGNIKLNSDYTGGDTYFYRQNFSNINTSIGKIVMWPGQVTHGHEGREVTSGTKYNLVIWTSRRPGDVNY